MKQKTQNRSLHEIGGAMIAAEMLKVNGGAKKPPPVGTTLSFTNGILTLTNNNGTFIYDANNDTYVLISA